MSIRFNLLLIAVGAVLAFLVKGDAQDFDLSVLGIVFLVGGCLGLLGVLAFRTARGLATRRDEPEQDGDREARREAVFRKRV